jgi:hypothetical protein
VAPATQVGRCSMVKSAMSRSGLIGRGPGPAPRSCVCAIAELATWCATPSTDARLAFRTRWS